jgi:hypothetical protein
MNITRGNYEHCFIDYLDGKLTDTEKEKILIFLGENPDLAEEFKSLEKMILIPAREVFPGKAGIKKTLISLMSEKKLSFEELCVASMEGDLGENENEILFSYLNKDKVQSKQFELFVKTVLRADTTITYPYKNSLKHYTITQRYRQFYIAVSLAASIILAAFMIIRFVKNQPESVIAIEEKVIPVDQNGIINNIQPIKSNNSSTLNTAFHNNVSVGGIIGGSADVTESNERELIVLSEIHYKTTKLIDINYSDQYFIPVPVYTRNKPSEEEFLEPGEFLLSMFRKKVLKQEKPVIENKITLWEIADAGMQGLSNLTAMNFYLDRGYDRNGQINHLTLETPIFGFSTPFNIENHPE